MLPKKSRASLVVGTFIIGTVALAPMSFAAPTGTAVGTSETVVVGVPESNVTVDGSGQVIVTETPDILVREPQTGVTTHNESVVTGVPGSSETVSVGVLPEKETVVGVPENNETVVVGVPEDNETVVVGVPETNETVTAPSPQPAFTPEPLLAPESTEDIQEDKNKSGEKINSESPSSSTLTQLPRTGFSPAIALSAAGALILSGLTLLKRKSSPSA